MSRSRSVVLALAVLSLAGTGCWMRSSQDVDPSASTTLSPEQTEVADLVRASVEAENARNVEAFLALWTDAGLEQYDVGTREELQKKSENFGQDPIDIVDIPEVTITGDTATATVRATVGDETAIAVPLYEVEFDAVREGDAWLLDGFEFKGGAPLPEGTASVSVSAVDYGFVIEPREVSGEFGIEFSNDGEEQHEITLFRGPDEVDAGTARTALLDVDGSELDNVPDGYEAAHLAFAEPGQSYDLSFAKPVAPGTYVLACYIPKGGFGEEGPVDPEAPPHIELGMIDILTVG